MTDHPAPNPNQPGALVTRVLRALPEDFWDVHVWVPSACASGSLDVADRKRIVAAVLPEVERRAKAEVDRLTALMERNGIRYCLCSRADRMNDLANPECPHHGVGMLDRLRHAKVDALRDTASRTDDSDLRTRMLLNYRADQIAKGDDR